MYKLKKICLLAAFEILIKRDQPILFIYIANKVRGHIIRLLTGSINSLSVTGISPRIPWNCMRPDKSCILK